MRGELPAAAPKPLRLPAIVLVPLAVVVIVLGMFEGVTRATQSYRHWPAPVISAAQFAEPLRSVNSYGLFANMTREQIELIFEGSDDGREWKAYEFKYKPGDAMRRPAFCQPHMPRLDWNLWVPFFQGRPIPQWFNAFVESLLRGKREVLDLLAYNPFPDRPPKQIRVLAYRYHFTTSQEKVQTGAWWKRELIGVVVPPASLRTAEEAAEFHL
jgi:hypothetical protein